LSLPEALLLLAGAFLGAGDDLTGADLGTDLPDCFAMIAFIEIS
jgi:hypothetical protein